MLDGWSVSRSVRCGPTHGRHGLVTDEGGTDKGRHERFGCPLVREALLDSGESRFVHSIPSPHDSGRPRRLRSGRRGNARRSFREPGPAGCPPPDDLASCEWP